MVVAGLLADPYTGALLTFAKERAGDVQIDHVVALSDAWQKGAASWAAARRLQFANDPLNLLAVDGSANQAKSDSDAASWLPPNKAYRCAYVARQVAVKRAYGLSVTSAEHDALARVLSSCSTGADSGPAPAPSAPPRDPGPGPTAEPTSAAPPTAPEVPAEPPAADGVVDYGTCRNAIASGAGPYRRGEPEYDLYRDADSDGIVCER